MLIKLRLMSILTLSGDDYECDRKLRLRKCSICHNEICKTCFYNPINKQHCHSCSFGKVSKEKNKCLVFKKSI